MGAGQFGAGHTTAVAASHAQLSSAHMMTGNLPVVPTRASLSASGRAASPSTIHSTASQSFFGRQSTSHPESFQAQTEHLQQSMQQSHFSPVTAGSRSTGTTEARGAASAAASGKPSAGTSSAGRDTNNSEARGSGSQAAKENVNRGSNPSANRAEQSSASRGEPNRSEWKTFSPPSHGEAANHDSSAAETSNRSASGGYWNRTAPTSNSSRGYSSGGYSGGGSRPQLNMRQPIVQPRSSGGYGGYGGGGSHSAPSSGGGHSGGGGHR